MRFCNRQLQLRVATDIRISATFSCLQSAGTPEIPPGRKFDGKMALLFFSGL